MTPAEMTVHRLRPFTVMSAGVGNVNKTISLNKGEAFVVLAGHDFIRLWSLLRRQVNKSARINSGGWHGTETHIPTPGLRLFNAAVGFDAQALSAPWSPQTSMAPKYVLF